MPARQHGPTFVTSEKTFSLVAVLLVSSALAAGCDQGRKEWSADGPARFCVDQSGRRVPDDQCGRSYAGGGNPFLWYYLGSMVGRRSYVPAMGGYAAGGGYAPVSGVRYAAPAFGARGFSGASGVARGGFGGIGVGMGAGE